MEYIVFFVAVMLLIGSISIALPSKASRKISKTRMEAKLLGCKISSTLYGENKFKNKSSIEVSYQIINKTNLEDAHFIRDKDKLILYSPVKLKYSDSFDNLSIMIEKVSDSLDEIIFTKSSISFLWKEKNGIEELKLILMGLDKFNFF
ncbi:MAG: hypothetical protein ACJ0FW_03080 [Gammaproteobacteria bacterium]|tara:strand:+ start:9822 stop:10265 length:444 start_codon:yes stop_codon:yes gene_type:complete